MASIARGLIRPDGREPALNAATFPAPVEAGERLGHLAAVGVLDADEQDTLHEHVSFVI
jgi:hypothetical protein